MCSRTPASERHFNSGRFKTDGLHKTPDNGIFSRSVQRESLLQQTVSDVREQAFIATLAHRHSQPLSQHSRLLDSRDSQVACA
ncbi:hypothetical protein DdX_16484 [Ditylenchus destructor]|uniref:Uncharacterized protein n=1 Tax=Ditylenchus destructor TaxID=166010 RepID=A0AAD4R015_9BILA|nr:hypothetical protein DdX_16484 [Ditylenchus destructor]